MAGINENQRPLKVSEVTVDRILSHYLWNSPMPPKRENMAASQTDAARTPVKIDAVDYMQNGAGRYASAADFKMFNDFFAKKLPARNQPYTFDEIGNMIDKEKFKDLKINFLNHPAQKTVLPPPSPNTSQASTPETMSNAPLSSVRHR